ncbi:ribonuclease Z [Microvirga massiliensis]|uniref:ribonuclease Z n=1 Tax=Microvirga massiliensis TaxID=1033741 RepID=UPI00062B32EB|nr:MBL fold metallo-hydrolase [Microvirga massiliensis]
MSWLVRPRLVNGPFDDPGLYLDFRFGRRAILFDLGDLTPLSSRELMRVSHVFVSHTHMDHIAGFDRLLRVCLHRTEPLTLVGPSGFIDQVEHRIRSFTWNLLDEHSIDFRLHVMEFESERLVRAAEFHARDAFVRRNGVPPDYLPGTVLVEENMRIEAVALDHGIPSLAFALREELKVNVLRGALDEMGLATGPWLGGAKRAARRGEPDDSLIDVGRDHTVPLGELRRRAFRIGPGQIVAYVTDAASHAENHRKIVRLAEKADQLFIEAMFLEKDRALATATRHLTARDAGALARAAHVKHFTVFHHSARYLPDPSSIGREVRDGFEAIPA